MRQIDALAFWEALGPSYFRSLSTFGAMPDGIVLQLLDEGRVLQLDAGEVLYRVGEPTTSFYIVLRGAVNNFAPEEDDGQVVARRHLPGDDMGFVPMIALCDRTVTAIAEEESVVVEISADQFFQLHDSEPDAFGLMLLNLSRGMARAIMIMARRIAELDKQLHEVSLDSTIHSAHAH